MAAKQFCVWARKSALSLVPWQVAGTYLLSRAAAGDYSKKPPSKDHTEVLADVVVSGEELRGSKLLRAKTQ
jgi:hypothetical protein